MQFQFSGDPVITAPRQIVWERLTDPDFIAASAPGVESVETVDPRHFTVVSGLGLGPMKVRFTMEVELFDVVERAIPQDALAREGPGLGGRRGERGAAGRSSRRAPGSTGRPPSDVSGTVASLGPRLVEGTARMMTRAVLDRFRPTGQSGLSPMATAQRSRGRVAAERRRVGANGRAAAAGAMASTTSTSRRH